MPLPLKPGFNFNYDRQIREPFYEMSSAEEYTDFYGISYMISGERLIYTPTFTTITQAGDIVFIPKHLYRRTTYVSDSAYERILLKFNDSMISGLISTIGQSSFDALCSEHVIRLGNETGKKVYSILMRIEEEWNHYNNYSELLIKGMLNELVITVLREHTVGGFNLMNIEERHRELADAIKYVKANLCDNPSLEETAAAVNVSPSHLSKAFINCLHSPYSVFLLNEKIAYARILLTGSNIKISDIAAEAGFSSSSYFSDCFRRIMGESPLQYRKKSSTL